MLRQGTGTPLVLLHGVTCSERVWRQVIPLLAPHHDVIALTALGHRGGVPAQGPMGIQDLVDDVERSLDALGMQQVHVAGNSMGGWMAIELARRGRALSVCALSPAGCWDPSARNHRHATNILRRVMRVTELTRWMLPVMAQLKLVRSLGMRDNAVHGERMSADDLIDMADDLLGCAARHELLDSVGQLVGLDPLPCPVTLAWAECDRIFPPKLNGTLARTLLPQARWQLMAGVGHLAMIDDPSLVAEVIRMAACQELIPQT
ncbi:putative hydrolase [Sterolibacterium denitrificans]|uniref:Hydrolase n=1 Tax=Sterolibacterium denitrificans TaxID=157592 RepID=A0A7Z7HQC4_9PROT|nr:alpha/beta fold hydrolase [Sterolibacterium denitrificans]SMB24744.1 putative hydrolase [Sterolibacterium denitrificans]